MRPVMRDRWYYQHGRRVCISARGCVSAGPRVFHHGVCSVPISNSGDNLIMAVRTLTHTLTTFHNVANRAEVGGGGNPSGEFRLLTKFSLHPLCGLHSFSRQLRIGGRREGGVGVRPGNSDRQANSVEGGWGGCRQEGRMGNFDHITTYTYATSVVDVYRKRRERYGGWSNFK